MSRKRTDMISRRALEEHSYFLNGEHLIAPIHVCARCDQVLTIDGPGYDDDLCHDEPEPTSCPYMVDRRDPTTHTVFEWSSFAEAIEALNKLKD
jgi:hypothetical protein